MKINKGGLTPKLKSWLCQRCAMQTAHILQEEKKNNTILLYGKCTGCHIRHYYDSRPAKKTEMAANG